MATLNRDAARAMTEVGVSAATDITGFGLLGHLYEMTRAAGVRARIRLRDVPILEEAWDLVRRGAVPGGTQRNQAALEGVVAWEGVGDDARVLLCDAQTSGGLLIAVPEVRLERLLRALGSAGVPVVAEVGEVTGPGRGEITVTG